ncbi:MAG TPA: hypothetical protein VE251_00350 [Xanthobacteraceae bacterium]|jgi:hypothetical protein|nr:hypothetical protein [Xanthobacteraceae bacterium]
MVPRIMLIVFALAVGAVPAAATDAAYPPGSRIGLAPPPGMVVSKNFFGYEDAENNAAIILLALPPQAYADLDKSITADALKQQGLTFETREDMPLSTGKAFLVLGHHEVENMKIRKWILVAASSGLTALVTVQIPEAAKALYPDAAIRAALATLAIRNTVPVEEQLSLLPFKVSDLAGFRVGGIVPGRALMLGDAAADAPGTGAITEPHLFVAISPGGPVQTGDRDAFARDVFATVPNLRDIRITTSEPLRIGGQQGHQILADARDPTGAAGLTVVQWLRFGGGAYLQMVGIARTEAWKDAYPRFRSVRDGIDTR